MPFPISGLRYRPCRTVHSPDLLNGRALAAVPCWENLLEMWALTCLWKLFAEKCPSLQNHPRGSCWLPTRQKLGLMRQLHSAGAERLSNEEVLREPAAQHSKIRKQSSCLLQSLPIPLYWQSLHCARWQRTKFTSPEPASGWIGNWELTNR